MNVRHAAECDSELSQHELHAEWNSVEHVSDGNRHLSASLDKIKARNMVPRMLEEKGVAPLDVERAPKVVFARGCLLKIRLVGLKRIRYRFNVRQQYVFLVGFVNET